MGLLLNKTMALRDEAWLALTASEAFRAFKALDDAVVALGGQTRIPEGDPLTVVAKSPLRFVYKTAGSSMPRRISQANAALEALKNAGEPLPVGRLLEAATKEGAEIGGHNPLNNFRSTLSKDPRFRSVMRNNMYFWWFSQVPLPSKWLANEALDLPLENGSSASGSSSSQEGGDGDAATMAH